MSRIPVAIIKQFVHFIFCPIPSVAARLCLSLHIKDDFAPHNLMTGEGEIIARGENDLVMVILSLSLIISFHFGSAICHSSQGDHSVFCPSSVIHYFNNGSFREMRWKCGCWRETTDPDGVRVMNFTARKQQNKQRG